MDRDVQETPGPVKRPSAHDIKVPSRQDSNVDIENQAMSFAKENASASQSTDDKVTA